MSKLAKKALSGKKRASPVTISSKTFFETVINAQCASAAPPLGPLLGTFGLNINNFCKAFNEKTANYKKGIPLPITVKIKPDRSYDIHLHTPSITYYLLQAAGIQKSKLKEETKSGEFTLKHAYEIAKIKHTDPYSKHQILELEEVVKEVVAMAKRLGIELVKEIDPVEYKEFLEKRNEYLAEVEKALEEEQKLKLQRLKEAGSEAK